MAYRTTDSIVYKHMTAQNMSQDTVLIPKTDAQEYVRRLEKVYEQKGTFSHEELTTLCINSHTMNDACKRRFVSGSTYFLDKSGLELFRTALNEMKTKVGL